MNRLLKFLKRPSKAALWVIYPLTLLFVTLSIAALVIPATGIWEVGAYAVYGLAAIFFGYSCYTAVIYAGAMKRGIIKLLKGNDFTRELLESFDFRTVIGGLLSFGASILYGVFNGVIGILSKSIWYGSLAAYYILLTLIRGGILLRHKKSKRTKDSRLKRTKTYLNSGILLLILNIALSVAIAQMIFEGMGFIYNGIMIYVSALYAFIKIGLAIYNFIRAHRQEDILIEGVRNISLIDGAVSILALQTAMLTAFSDGELDYSLMNTLTGIAVSAVAYTVAVFTVIKGAKIIKKIKTENNNGK